MVANSLGESRYRALTIGIRKRFSEGYQLEGNYVLAKDEDNDSNERDPFTDRSFNFFDLEQDWGPSDRDIRHKLNLFGYFTLPADIRANARIQARSAQPITPSPRVLNGTDRGRNSERKDNEFFSFDWRLSRAVQIQRRTRRRSCRSSRCSTPSTTRTTSTRSARRRCSISPDSCEPASAIRARRSSRSKSSSELRRPR